MAVLPTFSSFSENAPHLAHEAGYFFGKPTKYGVPDPVPSIGSQYYGQMVSPNYIDGRMAIARFNVADWPKVQHDIVELIKLALSQLMGYINQQK